MLDLAEHKEYDTTMNFIVWLFEPIFVILGKVLWRFQQRHENKVMDWSALPENKDVPDSVILKKCYWGIPYSLCENYHIDRMRYGESKYIEVNHSNHSIIFFYESMFILGKVVQYYLL